MEIQFVKDISFPGDGFDVNKGHLHKNLQYPKGVTWESNPLGVLITCEDNRPKSEGRPFKVLVFWSNIAALYYSRSGAA